MDLLVEGNPLADLLTIDTDIVKKPPIEESAAKEILGQLKHMCSELKREHEPLISGALHFSWVTFGEDVIKEYQAFVVNLIACNPTYLRPCINMIVKLFSKVKIAEAGEEGSGAWMYIHQLLHTICKLVPMTPTVLLPLLSERMPIVYRDVEEHECYTGNLFKVMNYLPEQRKKILQLVVDNMAKMDVNAPKDEIFKEEEKSDEEEDTGLFEMECEATDSSKNMGHPYAHKLDVLLDITFRYIYHTCHKEGKLDWNSTKSLYQDFLLVFDKMILPTYALNHVQFTMFYICSFNNNLVEGFIDYMWKKFINPNQQSVFRQVSVAYIASFLARAKYIKLSTVIAAMELMSAWIHNYIQYSADSNTQPSSFHHGPFYSVCQALFYTFVYRNSQLYETDAGVKCVKSVNFQRIVSCRLNPLLFCLPILGNMFASVSRQHQLAFCDTILEKNKRLLLPTNLVSTSNPLDSYFPFDPFILKISAVYITDLYQEYSGNPVSDELDSDMEDDQSEISELEDKSSLAKSPAVEFLLYGSSPGFNYKHF